LNAEDELDELARRAAEHQQQEQAKLAAMTPEERYAYIRAWAERVSAQTVPVDTALDDWLNKGGLCREGTDA